MDKKLSSSEIGNLWMTYQQKTVLARMLEHFLEIQLLEQLKALIQNYYDAELKFIEEIRTLFEKENVAVPMGYVSSDVISGAPRLYDDYFDLLFLRIMMNSFSLRSDLPAKITLIAKDIFDYAKEGGKLMIKNGWMEEPPPTKLE